MSFIFRLQYPWRKVPRYPLDRRLGEPQIWYGRSGEENLLLLPELELQPVGHPARNQSLYRLHYTGSSTDIIIKKLHNCEHNSILRYFQFLLTCSARRHVEPSSPTLLFFRSLSYKIRRHTYEVMPFDFLNCHEIHSQFRHYNS
jgi:hypothetical protein